MSVTCQIDFLPSLRHKVLQIFFKVSPKFFKNLQRVTFKCTVSVKFIFSFTTELCETKTLSDQNTEIFFSRMLYNPQAVLLKVVKNFIKLLPKSKSKEKTKTAKVCKTFPSYLCHTLMQSEQVFGLVRTGTCTRTSRPNTSARYSMCLLIVYQIALRVDTKSHPV